MRRKITPKDIDGDLPELTDQQKKFVEGILAGKTASDAYRTAYDCSKHINNSIWTEASKLRNHPNVVQWLSAARQAHLGAGVVTLEGHIKELERLKEIAIKTGNVGAAVQAEQLRGKAQGHYVERLEVTANDPLDTLRQIATVSPELARKLAVDQTGMPIPGTEWLFIEH